MDMEAAAMLRDSAQRYATDNYGFLQRHAVLADPAGWSAKAWQAYGELGWLALRLPQAQGGLDADALAIGAMMEVVGARLLMEPILASAIVGTGLVLSQGSGAQLDRLLPALAAGALKLAFAHVEADGSGACEVRDGRLYGAKVAVLHGDIADRLIVSAADASTGGATMLYLVDPHAAGV